MIYKDQRYKTPVDLYDQESFYETPGTCLR